MKLRPLSSSQITYSKKMQAKMHPDGSEPEIKVTGTKSIRSLIRLVNARVDSQNDSLTRSEDANQS
jgi:hypothetical protein